MTRNLRSQLAADAERWIRAWSRPDVSREDAAVMVTYWHLFEPSDPELVAEVLSRFSPAEPPTVPGLDWLPAVEADANQVVASLDVPAQPKALVASPPCCDDHSPTWCGVMEDGHDACCAACPEFGGAR